MYFISRDCSRTFSFQVFNLSEASDHSWQLHKSHIHCDQSTSQTMMCTRHTWNCTHILKTTKITTKTVEYTHRRTYVVENENGYFQMNRWKESESYTYDIENAPTRWDEMINCNNPQIIDKSNAFDRNNGQLSTNAERKPLQFVGLRSHQHQHHHDILHLQWKQ